MTTIINDQMLEERLIAQRQEAGVDKYDEVWGGVYVMARMANNEHQRLVTDLTTVLNIAVGWVGLGQVFPGANVSDREDDWTKNYRCPDVAVYLKDTQAEDRGAYWYGGPDFAIEVVSPQDRAMEKLPFYAKVGTRELLVIDRDPWALTLFRLDADTLELVAKSLTDDDATIGSEVLPLNFNLVLHETRPALEVIHHDGQRWLIDPTGG
ncbi:MAG: hypothetical protein CMJ64_00575 [Planctomycetaceae bacterium]|nr:hypothetical protein [Planctomycetaceae bacterium]